MPMDMYDEEETEEGGGFADEYPEVAAAAREAFPDEDWTDERLSALTDLIHACMDKMDHGEMGKGKMGSKKEKGMGGLALVFGAPKKK